MTSWREHRLSSRRHEAGAVRDNRGVRHLLSLTELTGDDMREIFARAARIEAGTLARRDGAAALFFPSSSLRTRVSFERGAAEMGLQPIVFPPEALDTVEDAVDIVGYLSAWVELLVVRHADFHVLRELAAPGILPVVNAMTNANHPCEVLSDLFALSRETDVRSLRVLVVGPDGNIARAWEEAHRAFGIDVVQACPEEVRTPALPWKEDLSDAVQEADVIITDGPGEHTAAMAPYRITADLLDSAPDGVRFAPCPPFVRGREVSVAAANHPAFVGYEFKRHLKSVQQAIMGWAIEG
ncbi:ornithine carbamoyltransferase [Microbacterium sp. str. 'China']|uniref:ornithine carbamoyltransferase n=1 Tax=Microbacterium sp. str. 'China' TaxID=2103230 RepID=UPI000D0147A6|nr:ornithine carbamoyltransferase [Microbacterium sp. str. 'China']AVL97138.1 ornithine carbamoyltransferase [Microbacterium sp. str. 'China']